MMVPVPLMHDVICIGMKRCALFELLVVSSFSGVLIRMKMVVNQQFASPRTSLGEEEDQEEPYTGLGVGSGHSFLLLLGFCFLVPGC